MLVVVAQRCVHPIGEDAAVAAGDICEAGRITDPQGLEQRGVDQAEDRGVGADAEGEGQHGSHREAGLPEQHAGGIAHVLEEVRDPASPGRAGRDRRQSVGLPKRAHMCGERVGSGQFFEGELARLGLGDALGAQRLVAVVEVLCELVGDLALAGGGQRKRRQAHPQRARPVACRRGMS